jgi:hypothetical protein
MGLRIFSSQSRMPRLLVDHWAQLVRDFKDREKTYAIEPRDSELLAMAIVDWIQITPIRQWNLFVQKRGEEMDRLRAKLEAKGFDQQAVERFLDDEELWRVTLELGSR